MPWVVITNDDQVQIYEAAESKEEAVSMHYDENPEPPWGYSESQSIWNVRQFSTKELLAL